jgi:hypothetical protein
MRPGKEITIFIKLRERDAPPEYARYSGRFGFGCDYCSASAGSAPSEIREACSYIGPCGPVENVCDINPRLKTTQGSSFDYQIRNEFLILYYNPATGAITGDLTGQRGQLLTSYGDIKHPRQAMIQFKIE